MFSNILMSYNFKHQSQNKHIPIVASVTIIPERIYYLIIRDKFACISTFAKLCVKAFIFSSVDIICLKV
jgi:hypothetical protein